MGNGVVTQKTYDPYGFPKRIYAPGVQDLNFNFNTTTGNLSSRWDQMKMLTENFTYGDALINRLTNAVVGNLTAMPASYAANGNISQKFDAGIYTYDNIRLNAVAKVDNPNTVISPLRQDVTYTSFNLAGTIIENGKEMDFTYGPDRSLIKSEVKNIGRAITKTKYYYDAYETEIEGNLNRQIQPKLACKRLYRP